VKSSAEGVNPRFFWSATVSSDKKVLHVKLVNGSDEPQALTLDLNGVKGGPASITTLHGASRWATNSIEKPHTIEPISSKVNVTAKDWKHSVGAYTIEVLDVPLQ
jgi:alpha-L-arabinofuranosidase